MPIAAGRQEMENRLVHVIRRDSSRAVCDLADSLAFGFRKVFPRFETDRAPADDFHQTAVARAPPFPNRAVQRSLRAGETRADNADRARITSAGGTQRGLHRFGMNAVDRVL